MTFWPYIVVSPAAPFDSLADRFATFLVVAGRGYGEPAARRLTLPEQEGPRK
jgi:hypothetical protein